MSKGKRNREEPVSTGSIALRIGLSSGLNLLLIFIVLDVVLFCVFLLPALLYNPATGLPTRLGSLLLLRWLNTRGSRLFAELP